MVGTHVNRTHDGDTRMSTLELFPNLEQGSDEWLTARCGLLTASTVGRLITPTLKVADNETARGLTETIVAERISGIVDYVHPTADMQRGTMDEPYARNLYAEQYTPVTELGFAIRTFPNGNKLGASPDGLIGDDGGLEIKSRRPKAQLKTFLTGAVPAENMAQIQASMLVLGRDWWDYCSYAGGWPLYVTRIHANPDWFAAIEAALNQFEERATEIETTYRTRAHGLPISPVIDHYLEMSLN